MNHDFAYMATLPGTPEELDWLRERLETLSVWEKLVLAAETQAHPPVKAVDAINQLFSLDMGAVYPASSYEELGECALRSEEKNLPDEVLEYIDFRAIGEIFEDMHPGFFIGNCYAACPSKAESSPYQGRDSPIPQDIEWSVKLKLASPGRPEGVWLRLPDYPEMESRNGAIGEIDAARKALSVESLDESTLLETRCVIPEVGNIGDQYESIEALVKDCNNLGFILGEQNQGEPHWMERFAAALEYEGCHTLRFALDISQNLDCYDWIPSNEIENFAAKHLRSFGVSRELIQTGYVDMKSYAEDLLETSGYMLTANESAYVIRNSQKFNFEFCTDEETAQENVFAQSEAAEAHIPPEDILNSFPLLARLSVRVPEREARQASESIREALIKRGTEGLRQFQAAVESEDCATLEMAVEVAENLHCFDFIEESSFRETAAKELLEKGLDERTVYLCFDFDAYAAITHDFEYIFNSADTGLYVHRNSQFHQQAPQQEQTGMTGQAM